MKVVLNIATFVMDVLDNENVRRNNEPKLKLLVDKNDNLFEVKYDDKKDIKVQIREEVGKVLELTRDFQLEQVFTLADSLYYGDDKLSIIYIALLNKESIKDIKDGYKLVDFDIEVSSRITIGENSYDFRTVQEITENNISYIHQFEVSNKLVEKQLMMTIIAYKYLKSRIDTTDIIYKLLPSRFALEDVRLLYELISGRSVDKSNFRKKIIGYCRKTDEIRSDKGYRPTQLYEFQVNENDIWL